LFFYSHLLYVPCSFHISYYPKHDWYDRDHKMEAHYAVPPEWIHEAPVEKKHPRLEMVGTSLNEPDCPDGCCRCQDSVKWSGPGEDGVWIAPNLERYPFHPQSTEPVDDEL